MRVHAMAAVPAEDTTLSLRPGPAVVAGRRFAVRFLRCPGLVVEKSRPVNFLRAGFDIRFQEYPSNY